jgi:hypothetical protein
LLLKNSLRTVAGSYLQSCPTPHPNCKLLAQAAQLNRRNPADCGLGTRGPGPIIAAPYASQKEKHSFSDGKRFTDFVLLRCFIDFQTTLVDSRNLESFCTFWQFFACLFSNCLAKYLVTLRKT